MVLSTLSLGLTPYTAALELMRAAARARIAGDLATDLLILVEHPPVVTLGRNARGSHLSVSAHGLAARGIELHEVERGGDVTYHGPGQLVGYPILDLKGIRQDLHWYLRQIEGALIATLARYGLPAERSPGYTGVWTAGRAMAAPGPSGLHGGVAGDPVAVGSAGLRKIASIGVHARDWVTWHGFALNVNTDLAAFELMVPCGIPDVLMTSMAKELGSPLSLTEVAEKAAADLAMALGHDEVVRLDQAELESSLHSHR